MYGGPPTLCVGAPVIARKKPLNLFTFDLQRIESFVDGVESVIELVLGELFSRQLSHLKHSKNTRSVSHGPPELLELYNTAKQHTE